MTGTAPAYCDAAEWGGAATVLDGRCRCVVCARCRHHTGNAHQGHHWNWCAVTRGMREPHFCCPDPEFGCELESAAPEPLAVPADEIAAFRPAEAESWTPEDLREFEARWREAIEKGSYTVMASEPWRERAEQAEAKLARIAAHCRERMNGPGRGGMSRAAAGIILGIAEGTYKETRDG